MNGSLSLRVSLAAELSILSLMLAKQAHEWTPSDEERAYICWRNRLYEVLARSEISCMNSSLCLISDKSGTQLT